MFRSNAYRILDIIYRLNGSDGIYQVYNRLHKIKNIGAPEVSEITYKKTVNILSHAYRNVLYYKELFKERELSLDDFRELGDLSKLPVLDKKIIRENFPDKIVDPGLIGRGIYNTTSGSTGQPLEFYMDRHSNAYALSSTMFFNEVMGVKAFDVHWNIKTLGEYPAKQKLSYWLLGKHLYSVLDLKPEKIKEISRQIDTIKPSYLEGYSASLERMARLLKRHDAVPHHHPKAIIATSETLTPSGRSLMQSVLGSEVFNRYGFREFSAAVAQECTLHEGLHINPLLTHVEIVDDNGDPVDEGEKGRILITDLNNWVMPFIRYDTGDLGVKGSDDCPCGLAFPLIKSLEGRTGEFLTSKTGDVIPLVTVSATMFRKHYAPYVQSYQFTQHGKGKVSVRIVPTDKYSTELLPKMEGTLREVLPEFDTEVIVVDDILPSSTGKTPPLIKT